MSEQPLTFSIQDKYGHAYKLVVDGHKTGFLTHLWDNGTGAGRLNVCFRSTYEWEIADLILFNESPQATK